MPEVSICMVSLNCKDVLRDCLQSLRCSEPQIDSEIIIVDNVSTDGTIDMVRSEFPEVRKIIENSYNIGFTRATNQAIEASVGKYILWLNTDTLLKPDSISKLINFLETHPKAGIVGPKVLNPDGSFQPQCKRGMPTPLASLFHLLKLDTLFPKNKLFGRYLLSYLPEDETAEIGSVSGCCLMAKRQVWDDIGRLDERIFGFGEDIDWCLRAKKAGWQVWYYPESVIVHLKGKGGAHAKPFHKIWGIHQAMWVIYLKHFKSRFLPITAAVWLGIAFSAALSSAYTLASKLLVKPKQK